MSAAAPGTSREVIWHDVECGGYTADLEAWEQLAARASGPILDLGCGDGRVALHLAARGHDVTAVDLDPALLAELGRRAADLGVEVDVVRADVRELSLGRRFALALAPMQLLQMLDGAGGRSAALAAAAAGLDRGGRLAAAILAPGAPAQGDAQPVPDVRELDGWIYSSLPLDVTALDDRLEVRRLRQVVSPEGGLEEEVDVTRIDVIDAAELESEAAAVGLRAAERIPVAATAEHVGSTIVVCEREGDG